MATISVALSVTIVYNSYIADAVYIILLKAVPTLSLSLSLSLSLLCNDEGFRLAGSSSSRLGYLSCARVFPQVSANKKVFDCSQRLRRFATCRSKTAPCSVHAEAQQAVLTGRQSVMQTDKNSNQMKTSQKVAAYISKYKEHDEPVNVDVDELGADWCNRQGSRPNIQICHQVLAPSFATQGFDPGKPAVGVARNFSNNSSLKQKLFDWNTGFSTGDERYPPIIKSKMSKARFN